MKKLASILFVLGMMLSTVGCAPKTGVITSNPEEEETWVMGQETENSIALQVNNESGSDITAIHIKSDVTDSYSSNLIPDGKVFHQGDSVDMYYNPVEGETEETEYTVKVTLAGKGDFILSVFPLRDMKKSVTIHSTKGVVFIKYVSLSTDQQVSTLDVELEAKKKRDEEEAQKKKEKEEQEAKEKAEQSAKEKAEQEAAKQAEENAKEAQKQQDDQSESYTTNTTESESSTTTTEQPTETVVEQPIETPSTEVVPTTPEPTTPAIPTTPTTDTPILETSPIANSFNGTV